MLIKKVDQGKLSERACRLMKVVAQKRKRAPRALPRLTINKLIIPIPFDNDAKSVCRQFGPHRRKVLLEEGKVS